MRKPILGRWVRPLDIIIILFSLAIIMFLAWQVYGSRSTSPQLLIQTEGSSFIYPLDEERVIEVEGPIGITIIEVKEGRARFLDSPCPDKLCVAGGWLEHQGEWNACLPNMVFAAIEGGEEPDDGIDFLSY